MKAILVSLFFLINVARSHHFCSKSNLVILETSDQKSCDIPRQLLLTLIELDASHDVTFHLGKDPALTFKNNFESKDDAASCADRPDCDVNWDIKDGIQISIVVPLSNKE